MRIGFLGGTGPAGSALAARLASVGYDSVIGSRSKYRAMEARDSIVEKWPDLAPRLTYADNAGAAECDVVIIATPWDGAATIAQEAAREARRDVRRWRITESSPGTGTHSLPVTTVFRCNPLGTVGVELP